MGQCRQGFQKRLELALLGAPRGGGVVLEATAEGGRAFTCNVVDWMVDLEVGPWPEGQAVLYRADYAKLKALGWQGGAKVIGEHWVAIGPDGADLAVLPTAMVKPRLADPPLTWVAAGPRASTLAATLRHAARYASAANLDRSALAAVRIREHEDHLWAEATDGRRLYRSPEIPHLEAAPELPFYLHWSAARLVAAAVAAFRDAPVGLATDGHQTSLRVGPARLTYCPPSGFPDLAFVYSLAAPDDRPRAKVKGPRLRELVAAARAQGGEWGPAKFIVLRFGPGGLTATWEGGEGLVAGSVRGQGEAQLDAGFLADALDLSADDPEALIDSALFETIGRRRLWMLWFLTAAGDLAVLPQRTEADVAEGRRAQGPHRLDCGSCGARGAPYYEDCAGSAPGEVCPTRNVEHNAAAAAPY